MENKEILTLAPQAPLPHSPNSSSSSTATVHPSSPAPSPRPIPRTIEANNCPTTFVQADTSSFKRVVQLLTGYPSPSPHAAAPPPHRPMATAPKKPSFKLYERRSGMKNLKMVISPGAVVSPGSFASPRKAEVLSPSLLNFPSLVLSPVTPLTHDPFNRSPAATATATAKSEEEKAIAEKGFYLHPSPRAAEPPQLLPLFPLTSPRSSPSPPPPAVVP